MMKVLGRAGSGISACEEALQRLLEGMPRVPAHVDLDLTKLTASIVSLEAGFDRGYLKKSRKAHAPLIARIQAIRTKAPLASVKARELELAADKLSSTKTKLDEAVEARDKTLRENLYLMLRVRELEKEIFELRRTAGKRDNVVLEFP